MEKVLAKQLIVHYIPAIDHWAYALTKPLSPTRFSFLRTKLNVIEFVSKTQLHTHLIMTVTKLVLS